MDNRHYQFLLNALKRSDSGRTTWLEYKEKTRWIDLSTADFTRRNLRGFNLTEADLSMAIFREAVLAEADFSDTILSCADMRHADMRNAVLDRARMDGANLQDANLADACLEHALLPRAKLMRAMMVGADLSGADLTGADLSGACLKYARLSGAHLAGANVSGADLTGAILDDEAPQHLLHFHSSVIDDRRYREMRCRVANFERTPDGDEDSQAKLVKMEIRRSAHRGAHAEDGAHAKGARPADAGKRQAPPRGKPAFDAVLRDVEPDLSTVEGCCRVLDIPVSATMDQIVKAFRAKAKVYHPDKVRHLSEKLQALASEEFRRLRQAYEALTRRTARPLVGVNWPDGMPRYTSPYDYSSAQYEEIARVNPTNTNILYNLAWKYFEDGRYADARAGFERVMTINPNDQDAQYNLVVVRLYSELLLPEMGDGI